VGNDDGCVLLLLLLLLLQVFPCRRASSLENKSCINLVSGVE
jgi:hypothetical protein